jgi:hypothetical protein
VPALRVTDSLLFAVCPSLTSFVTNKSVSPSRYAAGAVTKIAEFALPSAITKIAEFAGLAAGADRSSHRRVLAIGAVGAGVTGSGTLSTRELAGVALEAGAW